jgi:hypothetical protein
VDVNTLISYSRLSGDPGGLPVYLGRDGLSAFPSIFSSSATLTEQVNRWAGMHYPLPLRWPQQLVRFNTKFISCLGADGLGSSITMNTDD